MRNILHQDVLEAIAQSQDAPLDRLVAEFGPLKDSIWDPNLHAAQWDDRLREFYSNRVGPVLRAMGEEGTKLRAAVSEPDAVRNANAVVSLVLILALICGNEHASASNLTALALAIMAAVGRAKSA